MTARKPEEVLTTGGNLKPLAELAWRRILDLAAFKGRALFERDAAGISRAAEKWEAVRDALVAAGLISVDGGEVFVNRAEGWRGVAIDVTAEELAGLEADYPNIINMRGALRAIDAEIADDPIRAMRWRMNVAEKLRRMDMWAATDAKNRTPEQSDEPSANPDQIKLAIWREKGIWNEIADGPPPGSPFSRYQK